MKKLKLALVSVVAVFLSVMFVACDKTATSKTITDVSAIGLRDAYYVTENIDFEAVTIKATYDNGKSTTLTRGEIDLADANDASADTQFILYTDGLSSQGEEKQEGTYTITCLIIGEESVRTLCTIEVNNDMSLVYDLATFNDPEFVRVYKDNISDAEASGSQIGSATYSEDAFMTASNYCVGDDNEFIYKPSYTVFKKNTNVPVTLNINVDVVVKAGDNVVGEEVYTFNNDTFGFKFTSLAIGNTYTITMTPADWDLSELMMNDSTFTVTVMDGYNVYEAIDLGRINLLNEENIQTVANANVGDYGMSVRNIFYDPVKFASSGNYGNVYYYELWEEFLAENGKENLTEVNGIFIHNNITVGTSDIPAEYLVTSAETDNQNAVGTLRDFSFLYNHYVLSDFTFNGNLFTIDFSQIKAGLSMAVQDGLFKIYGENEDLEEAGHSSAFAFVSVDTSKTVTFSNLNTRGNMSTAFSDEGEGINAVNAAGSLILLKSIYGYTGVNNTIAKEFLMAWYMEGPEGQHTIDVSNSKVYDCFNSGVFSFASAGNLLTNCDMKRFGGPAIFLISRTDGSTKEVIGAGGVTVDASSVLESDVLGTEGWFVVQKATGLATGVIGTLDPLFNAYGATILDADNKMNLITITMDSGYITSNITDTYCDIQYGDRAKFDTSNATLKYLLTQTQLVFVLNDGTMLYLGMNGENYALFKVADNSLYASNLAESGDCINVLYKAGNTVIGMVLGLNAKASA